LNGKTAVQKAVWHQPQAILLDVVMPDMGGYDVVRLLQGAPQTKTIPVIVMTAKNFDDSTIKMIKAEGNVFGFLNKPFKPSDLIKMLEVVIKGGRAHTPEVVSSQVTLLSPTPPAMGGGPDQPPSGFDVVKTGHGLGSDPIPEGGVPEKRGAESLPAAQEVSSASPRNAPSKKVEEVVSSVPRKFLPTLVKGSIAVVFLAVFFLTLAEWTCRRAEMALGVSFFAPPLYPSSRFNSFLPYQWHDPKVTNLSFWDDGRVVYQFNQWGLRGPDFPLVAPNGVRRILLLGGTSTFGMGVGEKDTVSVRLEALLNENRPGSFQVINGGLWALSPEEQWSFVKGQGFNFKPETILWLCEARAPGVPSTQGLRWLADHRWLVSAPFIDIRFIQMLVQLKIRGEGESSPKEGDPLFREAEKGAKEQKVALAYWVLPRGAAAIAAFNENLLERLSRAVEKK
jgi:CheY-like chemotaxis protein